MAQQSEIEKLQRRYDENPTQWFAALAEAYRKQGAFDLARDIVRKGLAERPNYVSGHIVLGRCLVDEQNDSEAGKVFEQVLGLDAENIIALKELGGIAERLGSVEGAQRWFGRLLEVDPTNDDAQAALTRFSDESGASEAAPAAAAPSQDAEPATAEGPTWDTAPTVVSPAMRTLSDQNDGESEPPAAAPAPEATLETTVVEEAITVPLEPVVEPAPAEVGGDIAPVETAASVPETPAVPEAASPEQPATVELDPSSVDLSTPLESHAPTSNGGSIPTVEAEPVTLDGFELELNELPDLPLPGAADSVTPTVELEPVQLERAAEDALPAPEPAASVPEGPPEPPRGSAAMPDGGVGGGLDPSVLDPGAEPPQPAEATVASAVEAPATDGPASEGPPLILPEELETSALSEMPAAGAVHGGDEAVAATPPSEDPTSDEPVWIEPDSTVAQEPDGVSEPPEPEPVVTETMAEVYAKQGLLDNAVEVYRKLVEARPGDDGLAARLAELEAQVMPTPEVQVASAPEVQVAPAPEVQVVSTPEAQVAPAPQEGPPPPPPPPQRRYAATETGGTPARAFLAEVLASRPPGADGTASTPPPAEEPQEAPTSLEAVFGEAPSSPGSAPEPPAEPPPTGPAKEGGISFDEFFGGEAPGIQQSPESPGPDEPEKRGGGDDFKTWLEGLKS
jgi:tetratricopeptide (TPR) repeat protein